jgi:hypothetical protein
VTLFKDDPSDNNLNGFRPIPPNLVIDWRHFFFIPGVSDPPANMARPIDSKLAASLFTLPFVKDPLVSLAARNLLRGQMLGLSSGQRVAQEMGAEVLSNETLGLRAVPGWEGQAEAPLWYYILKEAERHGNGERLGAVGGRIVAEVFLGLLMLDRDSYLSRDPTWKPVPPIAPADGQFGIADLRKVAGVIHPTA